MNQKINIYEYAIGNNELPIDYCETSVFSMELIPELEWKILLAKAEKACIEEGFCTYDNIAQYILEHDSRFFKPTVASYIRVGDEHDFECEKPGIQHYNYYGSE